ncbi:DUF2442 domain-containing protein [Tumidithrix helvetica PCC 7403]|uniref:DUF2442 domain-containing protein n=1 Tax=Tumidithrix helvetica TaxID=3457545 RepID=UPI003CA3B7F3
MLQDILAVKTLPDYKLHLWFEDGIEGIVDLSKLIEFTGVFAPLQDKNFFESVYVNPESGTIQWANDADLDPDVLYAAISGLAIPNFELPIATEVKGDVIKLYRPRNARIGKVTVQDTIAKRQVQIDLQEREYAIATSAHQQKKLIICYGNLIKEKRLLKLDNPHSLTVLDS